MSHTSEMCSQESLEARAEASCNGHGLDPNDPCVWALALDQAEADWRDPEVRKDAYPYHCEKATRRADIAVAS